MSVNLEAYAPGHTSFCEGILVEIFVVHCGFVGDDLAIRVVSVPAAAGGAFKVAYIVG
jgi:hypothetical protein